VGGRHDEAGVDQRAAAELEQLALQTNTAVSTPEISMASSKPRSNAVGHGPSIWRAYSSQELWVLSRHNESSPVVLIPPPLPFWQSLMSRSLAYPILSDEGGDPAVRGHRLDGSAADDHRLPRLLTNKITTEISLGTRSNTNELRSLHPP
jgi:hypothetical protein